MIKVAVLEDNKILCDRVVRVISEWDYVLEVVGFSTNEEFIESDIVKEYDVLLVDLDLGGETGETSIIYCRQLKNRNVFVIVMSASLNTKAILSSIRAGAVGYIHKDDTSIRIKSAIKLVLQGQSPISPNIASLILSDLQSPSIIGNSSEVRSQVNVDILTGRELEILQLIVRGLTNAEVGELAGISAHTVSTHIRNIYGKLDTTNRAETIYEARNLGILK